MCFLRKARIHFKYYLQYFNEENKCVILIIINNEKQSKVTKFNSIQTRNSPIEQKH